MSYPADSEVLQIAYQLAPTAREINVVRYLPGGWSNFNFKIEIDGFFFVLRLSSSGRQDADVECQYLKGEYAPDLYVYDHVRKHILTRWMTGNTLDEQSLTPTQAAMYLQSLHTSVPRGIRAYDAVEKISSMYVNGNANGREVEIFEEMGWQPRFLSGCHNDLNPQNLFVTENGIKTLDWEMGGDNDPLFDLAGLCYGQRYSDEQCIACANDYVQEQVDLDFLYRTRIVYLCRENAWAFEQVALGNQRVEVKDQIRVSRIEIDRLYEIWKSLPK